MKSLALALVLAGIVGCSSSGEQPNPAETAFEGQIESSLVGDWKTPSGDSVISLRKDGTSLMKNHVVTGHGKPQDLSKAGRWLFSEGRLLMRGPEDGAPVTVLLIERPNPDRFEVKRRTPPHPIVYLRKL